MQLSSERGNQLDDLIAQRALSSPHSGDAAGSGSSTVQSILAAAMRLSASTATSAGSSTTRPRATFTRMADGFIAASACAPISRSVCGVP